jgi:hypothetical protein
MLETAHQIIRQPNGRLAVFSSGVNDWIIADVTAYELAEYYARRAAEDARGKYLHTARLVLEDKADQAYYQFTMTYEEACQQAGRTPQEMA